MKTILEWLLGLDRIRLADGDVEGLARRLRVGNPPVVGRIVEGKWVADVRTVPEVEEPIMERRILEGIRGAGTGEVR